MTFRRTESGENFGPYITETAELSLAPLNGKWGLILKELVSLASKNKVALYFRLNNDKIDITYDETVLAKSFHLKQLETKTQESDSQEVKRLKAMNPLEKTLNFQDIPDSKHPEHSIMTKVNENRGVGIDLNPEWIGVSVVEYVNDKRLDAHDVKQAKVIDYKLFRINAELNNKNSKYSKEYMRECLSGIADEVFKLVHYHNVGKIYLEDGLGKLKGGTKSRHLNGLLNYWGRSIFTKILERKAMLTECESLSVKYHVCDSETGELKYRNFKGKGEDDFTERPVYKTVTEYKQGIKKLESPVAGSIVDIRHELKSCVEIEYVWAGYSSVIGNMVGWNVCLSMQSQVLSKESRFDVDSLDNTCHAASGLVPDACSASIEIARRGLVKSLTGKVQLPLFDSRSLIVTKKDLLRLEQYGFCENGWRELPSLLRKVPKETWKDSGFVGYRNQHHSYFVRSKRFVMTKEDGIYRKVKSTGADKNDSGVRRNGVALRQ